MRTCSVKDCTREHNARGYCRAHYQRWYRGEDVTRRMRTYDLPRIVCTGPWPIACKDAWPISRMIWCSMCKA